MLDQGHTTAARTGRQALYVAWSRLLTLTASLCGCAHGHGAAAPPRPGAILVQAVSFRTADGHRDHDELALEARRACQLTFLLDGEVADRQGVLVLTPSPSWSGPAAQGEVRVGVAAVRGWQHRFRAGDRQVASARFGPGPQRSLRIALPALELERAAPGQLTLLLRCDAEAGEACPFASPLNGARWARPYLELRPARDP